MYIGWYIDKYRKRKHNEKVIMNITHITYEVMYNIWYSIIIYFELRLKKYFFFLPQQAKSESNTPLRLRNSPRRDPGVTRLCKSSRSDTTGQEHQEWPDSKSVQEVTWLRKSSRRDMTGHLLKKCHDWARAPGVTWLRKNSRSDMTGQDSKNDTTGWKKFAAVN